MKKTMTIVLAMTLLVSMLFVSCKAEVIDTSSDLVSVVFTQDGASKGLSRTIEDVSVDELYWWYTATKTDTTGLTTGGTSTPVKIGKDKGFSGEVGPFSQGSWRFVVYGYKVESGEDPTELPKIIYQGFTNVTLKRQDNGNAQTISVNVEPVKDGNEKGTIAIAEDLQVQNGTTYYEKSGGYDESITVLKDGAGENLWVAASVENRRIEVAPGTYKVTVSYKKDDITYATGVITVTVYSNLTTTVAGTLNEETAQAAFEVVKSVKRSVSAGLAETEEVQTITVDATPADLDAAGGTTVKAPFAKEGEAEAKLNVTIYSALGANSQFKVQNEEDAGAVVAGFDFNLENAKIKEGTLVTVTTNIGAGLGTIKVYHNDKEMESKTSADGLKDDQFYYDESSGSLMFVTASFSSFIVTSPNAVALNMTTGKLYVGLQDAIDQADTGDAIRLLNNVSGSFYINGKEGLNLDFNGCVISGGLEVGYSKDSFSEGVSSTVVFADSCGNGGVTAANNSGALKIGNTSNVTINGGCFSVLQCECSSKVIDLNNSNLTINGGSFANKSSVRGHVVWVQVGKVDIVVNGGAFSSVSGYGDIFHGNLGSPVVSLLIKGGDFDIQGTKSFLAYLDGKITIDDCNFKSNWQEVFHPQKDYGTKYSDSNNITINGGVFTIPKNANTNGGFVYFSEDDSPVLLSGQYETGVLKLNGGKINYKIQEKILKDCNCIIELSDGYYVISPANINPQG